MNQAMCLSFRCGVCNICGGDCLCGPDQDLLDCFRMGIKPVATFVGTWLLEDIKTVPGAMWKTVVNKWGVTMVIATKDEKMAQIAFTPRFYNDEMTNMDEVSRLYGYPTLDEVDDRAALAQLIWKPDTIP